MFSHNNYNFKGKFSNTSHEMKDILNVTLNPDRKMQSKLFNSVSGSLNILNVLCVQKKDFDKWLKLICGTTYMTE